MIEGFLSYEAAALYLSVTLAADAASPDGNADMRALAELQEMGLVFRVPGPPPRMVAASPDEAFDRMLALTRRDVKAVLLNLAGLLKEMDAMQREHRTGPMIGGASPIDLVADVADIRGAAERLMTEATEEYLAVVGSGSSLLGWPCPRDSRGVLTAGRVRLLYARAETPAVSKVESRITFAAWIDARIADGTKALIALPGNAGPALLIRSPAVAALLRRWFELLWNHSVPVGPAVPLTGPYRQRILALLAAGHRDAEVARATGTSIRTVRRHIAAIMEELGVSSRFEAGIAAQQRGWLESQASARRPPEGRAVGCAPDAGLTFCQGECAETSGLSAWRRTRVRRPRPRRSQLLSAG